MAALICRATIWLSAWLIGCRGVTVYVRGGFGRGDAVVGLSDIDLVALVDDRDHDFDARAIRVRRRYRWLRWLVPTVWLLVDLDVVARSDVEAAAAGSVRQAGLVGGHALHFRRRPVPLELVARPGLWQLTGDWRRLRGAERRPQMTPWEQTHGQQAAWLELQHWWRHCGLLFSADERSAPYRALRLVVEPARVWLWVEAGHQLATRSAILDTVGVELAARSTLTAVDEEILRLAQRIDADPLSAERIDCSLVVDWLAHMTKRVVQSFDEQLAGRPRIEVQLRGGVGGDVMPLVDWRAVVAPPRLDETFSLIDGRPPDPELLSSLAASHQVGRYAALRHDGVIIRPVSRDWAGALWRSVDCAVSDPVSFAIADGSDRAMFVDAPGWSVQDMASRAVNEHRDFLAWARDPMGGVGVTRLLTGARASLLWQSVEMGAPELCLDAQTVIEVVAAQLDGAGWLSSQTPESLLAAAVDGSEPDPEFIDRVRATVTALPGLR